MAGGEFSGWYAGTQHASEIALAGLSEGYLGLAASNGQFKALKAGAGYDSECDQGGSTNADDDIADAGDDVALNEAFGATYASPTYDDNGNLTFDGLYAYTYDAWNRLVKVSRQAVDGLGNTDLVTVGTYAFDAQGRRIQKVVTKAGGLDGTEFFYYNGLQTLEVRDGSEQVVREYTCP